MTDDKPDASLKDSPTLKRKAEQLELENRIKKAMEGISHKIAVISGKGGVGKTTVSANIAMRLALAGSKTGCLDVDITGPNLHKLLGVNTNPAIDPETRLIVPVTGPGGIKIMSMAFLLDSDDTPVIWRGPMKMGVIREFLGNVQWGALDYLVIDLPPGTGDEVLDIMQLVKPLDGIVLVSTSQELSLTSVAKTATMAGKMDVRILGVIENMSTYTCEQCQHTVRLFGEEAGVEQLAGRFNIPFLGSIPLEPGRMQQLVPAATASGKETPASRAIDGIFATLKKQVERKT
ncbi:MAG: Mrp/NBP35 family ATP-binding protein [Candidatus Lokiarchaeota archaeon]|nr:Mrp/NBP35 family ATP-binding protein [Candidatus Lokiarchaeota archaeon]